MSECMHDVTYHGVINLNEAGINVGAIDVWRCRICKGIFPDVKRVGDIKLEPKVGFDEAPKHSKWVLLVCRGPSGLKWQLTTTKPGSFKHTCSLHGSVTLKVKEDFTLEQEGGKNGEQLVFLIEENVNKALELGI